MTIRSKAPFLQYIFCFLAFYSWGQSPDLVLEEKIDGIVTQAIQQQAFPGCVVYAARKGKPFFLKAYGHHSYDSAIVTKITTVYDLASVTKVAAATLALMKMWEDSLIRLDEPIGKYVEDYKEEIAKLTIREMLAHQSGLPPHIQHYEKMKDGRKWIEGTLRKRRNEDFDFRVGHKLYAYQSLWPVIKQNINQIEISGEKKYQYSGLFFYMVPELVEQLSDQTFETYVYRNFYHPMNARTLVFNPLNYFEKEIIAPTEDDRLFRNEVVHGTVHDEGAALMRGVSGNAGLFGNALDLAKVWQMFLNDGLYDSVRYLKPETIHFFTGLHFPENKNHRGLGFDKPYFEWDPEKSNTAKSASIRSYGHLGFTGIMAWADPDEHLLYLFLSNRVHPSRSPNKLKDLRIRPLIHQVLYDYLEEREWE